jgi:hypothetical protein
MVAAKEARLQILKRLVRRKVKTKMEEKKRDQILKRKARGVMSK